MYEGIVPGAHGEQEALITKIYVVKPEQCFFSNLPTHYTNKLSSMPDNCLVAHSYRLS